MGHASLGMRGGRSKCTETSRWQGGLLALLLGVGCGDPANEDETSASGLGKTAANPTPPAREPDRPDATPQANDPSPSAEAPRSNSNEPATAPTEVLRSRAIDGVILIDDGEDRDSQTLPDPAQFIGYWYVYDDRFECDNSEPLGEVYPIPDQHGGGQFTTSSYATAGVEPPPETTVGDNEYGFRFHGGGQTLWGAGLGVAFANLTGSPSPFDLSAIGTIGLRFWVKSAGPEPIQLTVRVTDVYSEPSGLYCVRRDELVCDVLGCFDAPAWVVEIGADWRLVELPFDQLARGGWGVYVDDLTVPRGLDVERAYQLQFQVPVVERFDVWLDDVGFVLE